MSFFLHAYLAPTKKTKMLLNLIKVEALEVILACSLMDITKGEVEKRDDSDPWVKWKQGGMIGGAALAGGAVLAVSGGVVAPAIAQGLSTVAPTLGSLLPAIGTSGFAAAATAVGSVGGSIAIAASFGAAGAGLCGSKMATRIGNIEDFDFIAIGENHKKGHLAVGIMVSGLVFEEVDFVRPWESQNINLESLISQGLAGIQPVDGPGIENVDVTHIIEGHASYVDMTEHILKQLELDTYYPVWKDGKVEVSSPRKTSTKP
ncbi:transmembrane and coiled-coil domain-containing protein 4-like [Chenopodium quinoa]|uniref:transmembrane and coiled-coil domain-containing protein 4-like n=1 Tax=Chenopodium quinoa TaxID=63459 RepID=UPI000B780B74|nr:transmembrane and coiled-coil domain-containing protein 4-like [Chenopodium quinoa]